MIKLIFFILMFFKLGFFVDSINCPHGYFILKGMLECHKWLNCDDVLKLQIKNLIGFGAVKYVHLALWNSYPVAFNQLKSEIYKDDFEHGLNMLISLNPSPYVTQLIGFCTREYVFFTEYHKFNNAIHIKKLLSLYGKNSVKHRLHLCLNYAKILNYLHNSPIGVRVNCDTNDLDKLLSQLLITDSFQLVLNDIDALPEVQKGRGVKCGSREIISNFVAPEQQWKLPGKFNIDLMPEYNEKTDIWKAAKLCNYFIEGPESDIVKYMLFEVHKMCFNVNPNSRPTALDLVKKYEGTLREIDSHIEL